MAIKNKKLLVFLKDEQTKTNPKLLVSFFTRMLFSSSTQSNVTRRHSTEYFNICLNHEKTAQSLISISDEITGVMRMKCSVGV